ncbi:hypothetical protein CBR_g57063 [Chara braunii]|uniref:Myb-like domain-containing protein n=1 Tax=Chara braunii TaxID=69332 RepID=A0A388K823_CHABU|nr:hypothetical protein CBR_g57063 [Chara braunii]|eukprot:GBG66181.1 hypothetical protein CBR_g57063 [Chara braunii]
MGKHSEDKSSGSADKSSGSEDFPAKSSSAPRDLARSFGARGSAIIGVPAASPEGKMEVEGGPVVVHRPEDGHRGPSSSKTSTNGLVVLLLAMIGGTALSVRRAAPRWCRGEHQTSSAGSLRGLGVPAGFPMVKNTDFVSVLPQPVLAAISYVGVFPLATCVSSRRDCDSASACSVSAALSFLADLYRRLPLLLLVAVLLLVVVVFHICFLGRVPRRKQTRQTPKRARKMEKLQTKTTLSVGAGRSSRQSCSSAEGGRRPYDPTPYNHLSSHEIPLPPSDDDDNDPRSSTVPLGSGSTQDWMGSKLYRQASRPTYTDLLEGRTSVGYDAGPVDLSFGLRSGSVEDVTHTVLVNPASGTNHTPPSVRASALPDNCAWCSGQSGDERGLFSPRWGAMGTAGVAASRTRTGGSAPCGSTTPGGTIDGRGDDDECSATEVVGRKVWDNHRRQSRQASTSSITRGVAKINVGANDIFGDCDGAGGEDCAADDGGNDNDEDDDGEMEIRPVGRKRGGSRATNKFTEPRAGQRGKKGVEDTSAGEGAKRRDFWIVEHMIALIRAKRDQDLHLAGQGHNSGRMKTKTWKWDDVEKRLVQMGVTSRKVVDYRKKWDNLYQQFKTADEAVMVDAQGTAGAMQLGFGRDGVSREQQSALQTERRCRCCWGVAKDPEGSRARQLPAGVVIMEACVPRQLPAVVGQGQPRQPLPLQQAGTSGGGKTLSVQKGEATTIDSGTAAADHTTRSGLAEGAEEGRIDDVHRDDGRRDGKREGDDKDDRPLVTRLKGAAKEDDLEERSKLWVDCDAFWGQGQGKPFREAVGDCADYFVAIATGDGGAEPPSMLIMPSNDVPCFKIEDPAQREPALRRARNMEKLVLRTIHGWIFKSSSRSTAFARAESYITIDFAIDVARAVWQGFEWSKVVSPALVYHTLAMKMDVPLWFAGVKVVDRPEDDDMAARQEATVLHLVDCWTNAVWCGQWADGGRVKQERLSRLADCLRALWSACMWIMRMGGDDDRSHYEAWFYTSMVAKPTMIAAGSYIFNWRRYIVDTANLVLDRLGKAHLTLGDYPHCIPEWSDCELVFGHNAALKNAAEAAKHGWIGSGPAADDDGDEGS